MKFSSISILSATGAMAAAYGGSGGSGGNVAIVEIAAGQAGGQGSQAEACCGAGMSGQSMTSAVAMAAASTMMSETMAMAAAATSTGAAAMMMMTGTAAAAAAPTTHTVTVGGGTNLAYNPTAVMAAVGDTVQFMFMGKNHTVTQSTFDKPCNKMDGGLDSAFHPNLMDTAAGATTFEFTVNTTTPTWWYCRQKMPVVHCGKGMVFAVNPTTEKSFSAFQSMAIALNGTSSTSVAAVAASSASSVTLSVDNGAAATSAAATVPPASMSTMLAPGWNTNPSACECACFCGAATFPAGSLDGVGSFGGMPGSLPAPW